MKLYKQTIRWFALLGVNGLLLIIGLVILEIIFGGWLDTTNLNRLNLHKNCVLWFNVTQFYDDPNPLIRYTRDQYGLRGTFRYPSDIDILTIGGSTTDQLYIRDGETWQDVLQERFKQAGVSVIVGNAGVEGQSTYGHIENFESWFPYIPKLEPDFILFYVGLNDFYNDANSFYDRLVKDDHGFMQSIKNNSAIWQVIWKLHNAFIAMVVRKIGHGSITFSDLKWTSEALQDDYGFMNPRLESYAARLRILAELTRNLGARPIFVSQPSRYYRITSNGLRGHSDISSIDGHPYNGVDHYYMLKRFDDVTKSIAIEKNAVFIDLAGCNDWIDSDFYDFAHMTPQGVRKVGNLLFEELKHFYAAPEQISAFGKK